MTAPDDMLKLAACPFCKRAMMFRKALHVSDGNVDSIIHAAPGDCGMVVFEDGSTDESIIAKWNTRASAQRPPGGEVVEEIAQWLHDETEHPESYPNHTWPETERDDGQRAGGFVKIVPKHGQEYFRAIARRLHARFVASSPSETGHVQSEGKCICQDQHRKGYCTELGCPNGLFSSEVQTNHPLADLPEYLDCLEADLLSKDLDMRLKDMVQPGIWADRVRAALASRPAGATEQEVVRNALVAYDLTSTDGTVVYAATDKVIGAILAAIPVSSRSASGAEGAPKDVRKIASDAIRTFCQSLDAGTVQTSMGVERIYYSGLRLDALACAVAIAVASADRGGK